MYSDVSEICCTGVSGGMGPYILCGDVMEIASCMEKPRRVDIGCVGGLM